MKLLESHSVFEALLGRGDLANDPKYTPPALTIVYFTATWCGACQALAPDAIEAAMRH
jgi:thiol-disulfide isomerase/thioredoxin